ncbi:MAG: diacylglycerol kinase family protein [Bacilli bacterium]|nr:diacylglycerol kinase family protein [Bacilli bacterium]
MDLELRDKKKTLGPKRLLHSFKYAIEGLLYAFKKEQNMIIHIFITMVVVVGGILLNISSMEWLVCFLFIGLVIGTELMNTSIEAVVDLACPEENPLAKIAKDTAAASVMVFALTSVVVGVMIFLPKLLDLLK